MRLSRQRIKRRVTRSEPARKTGSDVRQRARMVFDEIRATVLAPNDRTLRIMRVVVVILRTLLRAEEDYASIREIIRHILGMSSSGPR